MAPFVPRHVSAGRNRIISFGGILETEFLEPAPGRAFRFRQTYHAKPPNVDIDHVDNEIVRRMIEDGKKPAGPPQHLHRFQVEYFTVEEGIMGLNLDGVMLQRTPEDPEFAVPANTFHAFFRHPDSPGPMTVVLSSNDNGRDFRLDRVFFENWYGFWSDSLMHEGKMDYIAWVQLFDAGDAYIYVPTWVPMRKTVSYMWGVVVGRWLGSLLGHQPFHREYTTDWDYAVAKMEATWPLRYFTQTAYKLERQWTELYAKLPVVSSNGVQVDGAVHVKAVKQI